MTVAVLGPEGTFSHELAVRLKCRDILLLSTIRSICMGVEEGRFLGLVPIENSEAGGVGPTLDGLLRCRVYIIGEAQMEVRHHLAAWEPLEQLRVIFAHPQTHEQCSDILDRSGIEVIHTSSNAASALEMLNHPHAGAIVSDMIAERYHLEILMRDIQNNRNNITRFVLLSRDQRSGEGCTKCSIVIDPSLDKPGLLYELLGVFARKGINLTRIESRPSKRGMGSYVFFVDFEVTEGWREAIAELQALTTVQELGCYGRLEEIA